MVQRGEVTCPRAVGRFPEEPEVNSIETLPPLEESAPNTLTDEEV